jgi:hypothetical protein
MGSKGSKLFGGEFLLVGDYLESADKKSRLSLRSEGLVLEWLSPITSFAFTAWRNGVGAPAEGMYLEMQRDGNLCCYAGTTIAPGRLLWQSGVVPGSKQYWHAVVQNDGNFCIYPSSEDNAIWCTGCAKRVVGLLEIQGIRDNTDPSLLMSGDTKSLSGRATIQKPYEDKPEFQIFQQTDLIINNKPYGMVLVIPALEGAAILGAWPQTYSKLSFFNGFGEDQIIIKVDPGPGVPRNWFGLRPRSGGDNHFNVPGDGGWHAGQEIIMYPWARPATINELWRFNYLS